MYGWQEEAKDRVKRYADSRGIQLTDWLGQGFDGVVVRTNVKTALKALAFEPLYQKERDVYLRLREHQVQEIMGFSVPVMFAFDDDLWVIEMEVVTPPYVLDFAGAYLDRRPDFPDDVMEEWQADKLEQFGEERWSVVRSLMAHFARMGIHLADVKPGNVTFAD
ncbi:MAG: hypothetical protein R3C19_10145 [Planctomycetaceae bacterium]